MMFSNGINISIMNVEDRLLRLEVHMNCQIDENRKISRRVDEAIEVLTEIQEWIATFPHKQKSDKRPHRCPICDGFGIHDNAHQCRSCNGKGIVWG